MAKALSKKELQPKRWVIGTLVMMLGAVPPLLMLNLDSVLTTRNLQTSSTKIKPQTVVNKAWCPGAACSNSALCRPCQQRFLFILSTGRAASTTLLGMINHLPNVRLAGENNNTLYVASLLEKNLHGQGFANLRTKVPARDGAWFHHSIPKQSMACTIQKVLQTINPPPEEVQQQIVRNESSGALALDGYDSSQIVGAKMIRIQKGKWKPLEAAEFFKYNFPCAKYIVNTRLDKEAQATSHLQYPKLPTRDTSTQVKYVHESTLEETVDKLKREDGFLSEFAQHMDAYQARLIYMEDWVNNVTHLNEVVEWLGFRNCQYDKVLHNNANGYEQDKSLLEVGGGCQAPIGF